MKLDSLYKLIRRFEGCRLTPYICPAGVWTCGWGSTGRDVFPGTPWTQEYADSRLAQDALKFAKATMLLSPNLDEDRLCAIADFAYNVGLGALKASTLRKKLARGEWDSAKVEIKKWTHGGGKVLPGLVIRRAVEAAML